MKHYIKSALARFTTMFALIIALASQAQAANWYVTAVTHGDGTGSSWDNGAGGAAGLKTILGTSSGNNNTNYVEEGTYNITAIGDFSTTKTGQTILGGFKYNEDATRGGTYNPNRAGHQTTLGANGTTGYIMKLLASTTIEGFTFTGVVAGDGSTSSKAALWVSENNCTIKKCIFTGNAASASGFGGAFTTLSGSPSGTLFENCLFYGNGGTAASAASDGYVNCGAKTTVASMTHCTFYVPKDGTHGVKCIDSKNVALKFYNSILDGYGSTGGYGNGGIRNNTSVLYAYTCVIWSNPAGATAMSTVFNGANSGNTLDSGDNYPGFTAAGSDFTLAAGSPIKTAGNASYTTTDGRDIVGTLRSGTTPSIGAYEYVAGGPQHNLTVNGDNGHSYTFDVKDGSDHPNLTTPLAATLYNEYATFTLTADDTKTIIANTSRYKFKEWNDGSPHANGYSFNFTADKTFTLTYDTQYKASVTISPVGASTVTMNPADGWQTSGGTVTFTPVTPNGCYKFDHWSGADVPSGHETDAVLTLSNVTGVKSVTANYANTCGKTVILHTAPVDLQYTGNTETYTGDHSYTWLQGQSYDISVAATQNVVNTQYRFTGWQDDDVWSSALAATNYNVPGNRTITAYFNTYQLLTTSVPGGHGTITTNVAYSDNYIPNGTAVTLTAVPSAGYAFSAWGGNVSGGATNVNLGFMTEPKSATATFVKVLRVDGALSNDGTGQTWATGYKNLSNALAAASSGDQVWVKGGQTYSPGDKNSYYQIPAGVGMYGGFAGSEATLVERVNPTANPTTISGDIDGVAGGSANDCPKLVECAGGGGQTVDGFTLTGAYSSGSSGGDQHGGAVRVLANNVTVRNCILTGNTGNYGAALGAYGSYTGLLVENCVFTANTGSSPAMYHNGCTATVRNCTIAGNFNGNSDGSFATMYGTLTLQNTILWDESATWPGGFKNNEVHPSTVMAYSCCVKHGWDGYLPSPQPASQGGAFDKTSGDPLFIGGSDYRLSQSSPCIDAGSNTYAAAADMLGVTRPQNGGHSLKTDIGAYEMLPNWYTVSVAASPAGVGLTATVGGQSGALPLNNISCQGLVSMSASVQTNGAKDTIYTLAYWTNTTSHAWSSANPYSFTITQNNPDWVAVFSTQYKVTASPDPANGGTITTNPASGWVNAGANVTVQAFPDLASFQSAVAWKYGSATLSADNPYTFAVNCPTNITASFTSLGVAITVETSPKPAEGIRFLVDGAEFTNTWTFPLWVTADTHAISMVDAVQDWNADGTGYLFTAWNATVTPSYTVPASPATVTATCATYYKLTTSVSSGGTITTNLAPYSGSAGYYSNGVSVTVTAHPTDDSYAVAWGGSAATGATISGNDITFTMNAAKSLTATFTKSYFVEMASKAGANGAGWDNACTLDYATAHAGLGEKIFIKAGTYIVTTSGKFNVAATSPSGGSPVEIYGGFAGAESGLSARPANPLANLTTIDVNGQALAMKFGNVNFIVDGIKFINQAGAFADNVGAICVNSAVANNAFGSSAIRNCVFQGNQTAINFENTSNYRLNDTVENCVFDSNTGLAINVLRETGLTIRNCSLYNNPASSLNAHGGGNGDGGTDTSANLANLILNDQGPSLGSILGAKATLVNSCVRKTDGDACSVAVVTNTPGFVNAANHDFRLKSTSGCLTFADANHPTTDINGKARTAGAGVSSLGAYEGTTYTVTVTPTAGAFVTFNGYTCNGGVSTVIGVVANSTTNKAIRTTPIAEGSTTQYVFDVWSVDGSGAGNAGSLTVNASSPNRTVDATYIKQFMLTGNIVGSGSVDNGFAGSAWYNAGTGPLSFTATPTGFGSVFTGWSGDLTGSSNPGSVTMNGAKSVTATFIPEGPTTVRFQ